MSFSYPTDQLVALQATLGVVAKESRYLEQTRSRLLVECIDATWVSALEGNADLAERVEAFASRFGRLQDTLGDKLLPRMARLAGYRPAAPIELLSHAEKLDWITSAEQWMEWRKLRNRLVHEYVSDPAEFAEALNLALHAGGELLKAEQTLRGHAHRLGMT